MQLRATLVAADGTSSGAYVDSTENGRTLTVDLASPFRHLAFSGTSNREIEVWFVYVDRASGQQVHVSQSIRIPFGGDDHTDADLLRFMTDGAVLAVTAVFSTPDAPQFGFDVSAQ